MRDSDYKKDGAPVTDYEQKDKRRRRTVTVEAVTRSPRGENAAPHENKAPDQERTPQAQPQRRSYNPNFTADNKFIGGSRPRQEYNPQGYNSGREGNSYNHDGRNRDGGYERRGNYDQNRTRTNDSSPGYRSYNKQQGDVDYNRYDSSQRSQGNRYDNHYDNRRSGDNNQGQPYNRNNSNPRYGSPSQNNYNNKKGAPRKFQPRKDNSAMDPGTKPAYYPSYNVPLAREEIRLNRYISMSGKCSRREADQYIQNGDVSVNGAVVTELGTKVQAGAEVRLRGQLLNTEKKVYILMNKPKGFVTSVDDPHADKTVMDIVRNACEERIYPVGRLDKNSLGVLLLTNDGDLTEKLTHPTFNKRKVYQVTLNTALTNGDLDRVREGIELDDGIIIPDAVEFVGDSRKDVGIEIHSGRNRIVRRIFEELGYSVRKLDRVQFAGLTKKNLKRGQWRFLSDKEVAMLKSGRYD